MAGYYEPLDPREPFIEGPGDLEPTMRYILACRKCFSTCSVRGDFNTDQNTINLDEESKREWQPAVDCDHKSAYVIGAVKEEFEGGPKEDPRP